MFQVLGKASRGLRRTVCIVAVASNAGHRMDATRCRVAIVSPLFVAASKVWLDRPALSASSSRQALKGSSTKCSASASVKGSAAPQATRPVLTASTRAQWCRVSRQAAARRIIKVDKGDWRSVVVYVMVLPRLRPAFFCETCWPALTDGLGGEEPDIRR